MLRPGGHLVISDPRGHVIGSRLYPLVKWLDDEFGYVPTWQHLTSEYLAAALPAGFLVRSREEPLRPEPTVDLVNHDPDLDPGPVTEPGSPPDIWALHPWAAEASSATYRDHPALVVWHFRLSESADQLSRATA